MLVLCAEGISDLCQKNAEVIILPADPTKCTAEGPEFNGPTGIAHDRAGNLYVTDTNCVQVLYCNCTLSVKRVLLPNN